MSTLIFFLGIRFTTDFKESFLIEIIANQTVSSKSVMFWFLLHIYDTKYNE